jgi:hypothetical protein
MATAEPLPARWTGPEFSEDLAWRTSLSPAAYAEDLAAAKREGAREAVERIRAALMLNEGDPIPEPYATRVLDEEAAR